MNNGKICISVCEPGIEELAKRAKSAGEVGDLVEMRLDCLEQIPDDLSNLGIDSKTIVTFRPNEQGGHINADLDERSRFWKNFRIECGGDLELDVCDSANENIQPKICSFHDFSGMLIDGDHIYQELAASAADVLKIAVNANDAVDAINVWRLLDRAKKDGRRIIPIAMGEAGKWTRLLGLAHGAFLTYASLETGNETAPGQVTARDLIDIYRVKQLDEHSEVYGILAGDTTYTMSPYIHNAAFTAHEVNAVFIPFQVSNLEAFMTRMVRPETREINLNLHGFSVTNPHKQTVIEHLDHLDEAAAKIGAVNTIKMVDGKFHGFNTDWEGFLAPLKNVAPDLSGARVAVVGAGGAARACVYAMKRFDADVTVFAREFEKARILSDEFDAKEETFEDGDRRPSTDFSGFDIVVNTTPLGTRGERMNETVATAEKLNGVKLVYDLVYNPSETKLMHEAKQAGAQTIGGFDMLIAQAARQYEIWIGNEAPIDEMTLAARKRLDEN